MSIEATSPIGVMKMALEALTDLTGMAQFFPDELYADHPDVKKATQAITALRQAIAAAEQHKQAEQHEVISLQCAHCQVTIDTLNDKVMYLMGQAQKQEPDRGVAYSMIDRFLANNLNSDEDYAEYSAALDSLCAPPQRQPLTEQWVEVTETLLNAQHPWLYEPMWIAMPNGHVTTGYYEWRQGRSPDRFITDDLGDMHAFQAAFVMPLTKPKAPIGVIVHGITGEQK